MFGSAFGSNTNTNPTFGTPSNTFGSSTFGTPAQSSGQGLFGSSSNVQQSGGLFGSSTPSTFGSTGGGTFGSSGFGTSSSPFGAQPQQSNVFGGSGTGFGVSGSSAFGSTGGGGFGSTVPSSSGVFGSTTPSAFGATQPSSSSAFGGFGSSSTFGGGSTASTFGGGGSSFGAPTAAPGTSSVRFSAPKSETGESFQSISAMTQYRNKSFEELRLEDYQQGNKGGMAGSTTAGGGLFGSSTTGQSAAPFGATSNAFGSTQTQPSTFGGVGSSFGGGGTFGTASPFGSSGTAGTPAFGTTGGSSLFGGQGANTSGGGLFGSTTSAPSTGGGLFGSSTGFGGTGTSAFGGQTSTGTGLFGSSSQSQQQQQQQPSSSGGLFGTSTSTPFGTNQPSPFGATTTTSSGGLFGSSGATGGGLFGSSTAPTSGGGLFGNSTGAGTSSGGGLFGTSAAPSSSSGGLFGSTTNNLFGAPQPSTSSTSSPFGAPSSGGGLFGSSTPSSGSTGTGLFGTSTGAGGLFGSTQPASAPTTSLFGTTPGTGGGLFGTQAPQTGGLFGAPSTSTSTGLFGSTQPSQQALQTFQPQQQQQTLSQYAPIKVSSPGPYASGPESQVAVHMALAKRAWKPVGNADKEKGGEIATETKLDEKLVSKTGSLFSTPSKAATPSSKVAIRPRGYGRSYGALVTAKTPSAIGMDRVSIMAQQAGQLPYGDLAPQVLSPGIFDLSKRLSINKAGRSSSKKPTIDRKPSSQELEDIEEKKEERKSKVGVHVQGETKHLEPLPDTKIIDLTKETVDTKKPRSVHCPTMSEKYTMLGYRIEPPMEKLEEMSDAELTHVQDFEISRPGFGSVRWISGVDVRDLNVDEVIEIENQSIEVYRDDRKTPKRGTKLNKPAICIVDNIYKPPEFAGSDEDFEKWLKTTYTKEMGATFIDYDPRVGRWMFKVEHFTKYAFNCDPSLWQKPNHKSSFEYPEEDLNEASQEEDENWNSNSKDAMEEPMIDDQSLTRNTRSNDSSDLTMAMNSVQPDKSPWDESEMAQTWKSESNDLHGEINGDWLSFGQVLEDEVVASRRLAMEKTISVEETQSRPLPRIRAEEGPTWKLLSDANIDSRILRRHFRVSWGPDGKFAYGGDNHGAVQIKVLSTGDTLDSHNQEIASLQVHRTACLGKAHQADVEAVDLIVEMIHRYMALEIEPEKPNSENRLTIGDHRKLVWSLVNSLWGYSFEPANIHESIDTDVPEGFEWFSLLPKSNSGVLRQETLNVEALESFKRWLRESLGSLKVDESRKDPNYFLSIGEVGKAAEAAMDQGNFLLATLICQAESHTLFRELLHEQIEIWNSEGCPISKDYLDQFSVLAGDITSETQGNTGGWLRSLAMHVFHKQLPLEPFKRGLNSFCDETWSYGNTQRPLPWYIEDMSSIWGNSVTEERARQIYGLDTMYHIMRLACDSMKYPLKRVLDSKGHSPNPLKAGLQWHLFYIFKGLGVFGNGLTLKEESNLCMSYILELEIMGSWQWALYVANFLPSEQHRSLCIQELLNRHVQLDQETATQLEFVRSALGTNEIMIARAQAYRAKYEVTHRLMPNTQEFILKRRVTMEIAYLAGAQDWQKVIISAVVPKLVADGEEQILLAILEQARLAGLDTTTLPDWELSLGMFELYAILKQTLNETGLVNYGIEKFLKELEQLRSRLVVAAQDERLNMNQQCAAEMGTWVVTRLLELQQAFPGFMQSGMVHSFFEVPCWEDRRKSVLVHQTLALFDQ